MQENNVLSGFKVSDDIEMSFENNEVYLVLVRGDEQVVCNVKGELVVENCDVCFDGNPQNSVDRDFKYLQVGDSKLEIDQSDIDLNGVVELNQFQIDELNKKLKDNMILA